MIPELTRERWQIVAMLCWREAGDLETSEDIALKTIAAELRIIGNSIMEANP